MTTLPYPFREQCEKLASDWRACLGLHAFDPLPARRLAEAMSVCLWTPSQVPGLTEADAMALAQAAGWWGVILCFAPPTVVYHPGQPPTRFESTIMHELAHLILAHPPGQLYLAPDGTYQRAFSSQVEAEAAFLGSCLQIPRRGVLWARGQQMKEAAMARHFGASPAMVRWRCQVVTF